MNKRISFVVLIRCFSSSTGEKNRLARSFVNRCGRILRRQKKTDAILVPAAYRKRLTEKSNLNSAVGDGRMEEEENGEDACVCGVLWR